MRGLTFLAGLAAVLALRAEGPLPERYQAIVDRQMFGEAPAGFDPSVHPDEAQRSSGGRQQVQLAAEQQKLASAISFSVFNVDSDGTPMVGFTDNSDPKAPRNYYMREGESRDGWTVKAIDLEVQGMTVVKGEVEVTLKLGGDSSKGDGTTAAAGEKRELYGASSPAGGSLRARSRMRRNRERQLEEENRKLQEDLAQQSERQAEQMRQMNEKLDDYEARRQDSIAALEEVRAGLENDRKARREAEARNQEGTETAE